MRALLVRLTPSLILCKRCKAADMLAEESPHSCGSTVLRSREADLCNLYAVYVFQHVHDTSLTTKIYLPAEQPAVSRPSGLHVYLDNVWITRPCQECVMLPSTLLPACYEPTRASYHHNDSNLSTPPATDKQHLNKMSVASLISFCMLQFTASSCALDQNCLLQVPALFVQLCSTSHCQQIRSLGQLTCYACYLPHHLTCFTSCTGLPGPPGNYPGKFDRGEGAADCFSAAHRHPQRTAGHF